MTRQLTIAGGAICGLLGLGLVDPAMAQGWRGASPSDARNYVSIEGGLSLGHKFDLGGVRLDTNQGWVALANVGHRTDWGLRAELEGARRQNNSGDSGIGADVRAWSVMGNLAYDFDAIGHIRPYVGVGAGVVDAKISVGSASDSQWAFGYQGLAGIGLMLSPNTELFFDYHYLSTAGVNFTTPIGSNEKEYRNHSVLIGLRWNFVSAS